VGEETSTLLSIAREERGGAVRLVLDGELDLATAPLLARAIGREQRADRPVIVDLVRLRFMDSCGLRELLRAAAEDPGFRIAGPVGQVRRVIGLCGVGDQLARAA
jgi:anti-anti-sigma factor